MELRKYQTTAIEKIREAIKSGKKRILLVAPAGSGKTVIAAEMIRLSVSKLKQSVFIAHRREIIFQTSEKLTDIDVEHGFILSGHKPSMMADVHIASIQTMIRRDFPNADILIFDEAHHVSAGSYQKIIKAYPNAFIIGLTATPCRKDGKGLGATFETLIQVAHVSELIELGFLVPIVAYAPSKPDLESVHIRAGDYKDEELGEVVDKPKLIGDIVDNWHEYAGDRQTIVFCATIAHSNHMVEQFKVSGVNAEHIDGETKHDVRANILLRLKNGNTQVLCNVGVATEGYDNPVISCIVLARPTKSLGLFIQMAGRGMRPFEGKRDLLLLDHAGAVYEHGLPDQDIDWTLESGKLAYEKRKYEKKIAQPWLCDHCSFINQPSRDRHCQQCGMKPIKFKSPAIKPGKLKKLNSADRKELKKQSKEKIWKECFWICHRKGLKLGAAAHIYKNRVGVWPRGFDLLPKEPSHWQMLTKEYYEKIVKTTI